MLSHCGTGIRGRQRAKLCGLRVPRLSPTRSHIARPTACHPERSEGSRQLPMAQRSTNNCGRSFAALRMTPSGRVAHPSGAFKPDPNGTRMISKQKRWDGRGEHLSESYCNMLTYRFKSFSLEEFLRIDSLIARSVVSGCQRLVWCLHTAS